MEQVVLVEPDKDLTGGVRNWKLMKAPKSHWSNIPQYDNTALGLGPLVNSKTKHPKTGLSKDMAKYLEQELGLEPNELSPRSEFWIDFQIKITAEIQRLDLDEPEDLLAFHYLRSHKLVAHGHAQLKKKSYAQYVLYNDVDEAKQTVKKGNVKKDAYKAWDGMTVQEMIDVLMVMGKPIVSTNESIINALMGRVVEKEAKDFLDIVEDNTFKMKLFVLKCVHYDIMGRSRGKDLETSIFSFGNDIIGEGISKVVQALNAKANSRLYAMLEKRLDTAVAAGTLAGVPIMTGYEVENKLNGEKKTSKNRNLTSNASKGTKKNQKISDNSVIKEVTGDGNDSGDFDEGEEIIA